MVIRPNLRLSQQTLFVYTCNIGVCCHMDIPRNLSQSLYGFKHHFDGKEARGDQYHKQAYCLWPQ